MKTIGEEIKIVHVAPDSGATSTYTLAAGTTDVNSVAVDALGYSRIAFLWAFGDNTASGTFTGSIQGSADGTTGWTTITGASSTFTAGATDTDDKLLMVECNLNPTYRYYRAVSDRGTANTALNGLFCLLGRISGVEPITQSTAAGQFVQAPVIV
jgi:hypothetical protein